MRPYTRAWVCAHAVRARSEDAFRSQLHASVVLGSESLISMRDSIDLASGPTASLCMHDCFLHIIHENNESAKSLSWTASAVLGTSARRRGMQQVGLAIAAATELFF